MDLTNKKLVRVVQILFGIYLVFFSLIGYFISLPPPQYNAAGSAFLTALFSTGYMFHVMSLIFLISGITFLVNKASAFGSILLAPVTFNILIFHLFLDIASFGLALIPIVLNLYLLLVNWPKYKPLFKN